MTDPKIIEMEVNGCPDDYRGNNIGKYVCDECEHVAYTGSGERIYEIPNAMGKYLCENCNDDYGFKI